MKCDMDECRRPATVFMVDNVIVKHAPKNPERVIASWCPTHAADVMTVLTGLNNVIRERQEEEEEQWEDDSL